MKNYLFRGKTPGGAWVEGNLLTQGVDYKAAIRVPANTPVAGGAVIAVIPETVAEFTGLTDKNGKRIFEGDIVKLQPGGGLFCFNNREFTGVVQLEMGGGARNTLCRYSVQTIDDPHNEADFTPGTMKVIGNIHDNPELLKVVQ